MLAPRDPLRPVFLLGMVLWLGLAAGSGFAGPEREPQPRSESGSPGETDSAYPDSPALPEDMTLDEVLDYAGSPPPADYPDPVPDDAIYVFTLVDQLEYRLQDAGPDPLGWEAQGWIGYDLDKFRWKHEGETLLEDDGEGETETDLLYSRLFRPFWDFQLGVRYANEWSEDDYGDTWSGVLAVQGLAPYKFEIDASFYVSEHGDLSFEFESEYDLRITQRLVFQPRTETAVYVQDVPEKGVGAGLSDLFFDFRLRYEIERELAPYVGFRSHFLLGETGNLAEAAGRDTGRVYLVAGARLAF